MNTETRDKDFMKAFKSCNFKHTEAKSLPKVYSEKAALEEIIAQYKEPKNQSINCYSEFYDYHIGKLPEIEYTKETILAFCQKFRGYEYYRGVYISALVNNIIKEDETITIKTDALIGGFGYKHSKGILIIERGTDDYTGLGMSGGEIIVNGDVGKYTGHYMSGGKITVKGSAANRIGHCMSGGNITIEQDAGDSTGENMHNGEIIVKGSTAYATGQDMTGGKITVEKDMGKATGLSMSGGEIIGKGIAKDFIGAYMKGGKIIVGGKIGKISWSITNGEIWESGKKVYPRK